MFGSNDERDVETLRELPLEHMLTTVLNAAIKAQAESALTTAEFVKEIGFVAPEGENNLNLTDTEASTQKLNVRKAELRIDSGDSVTSVTLPFISLFNIPSLEIDSVDWSFKAELKSIESFRTRVNTGVEATTTGSAVAGVTAMSPKFPLPVQLGATMKVMVKEQVDFEARTFSGREQKYSLNVHVKASSGPTPRGIERLFDIADRIITQSLAADISTPTE
jgi:hypothetical protein